MDINASWLRIHGGVTHFPIALIVASLLFDAAGHVIRREPHAHELRAAGFYALLFAAAAAFASVASGLVLAGWETGGRGMLAEHHAFLWPGFALLVGLAAWRIVVGRETSRRAFAAYLVFTILAAALMLGAGYWGGEMVIGGR